MALRNIYTVNATQVVISEPNPQGLKSVIDGYPIDYDSRSYNSTEANPNGDSDLALICAQADYSDRVKKLATANSATRVMWTVTIDRHDGVNIARKSWGALPDMTPEPEPEEETEEQ